MIRTQVLTAREKLLALIAGILLVVLVITGYWTSKDAGANLLNSTQAPIETVQDKGT